MDAGGDGPSRSGGRVVANLATASCQFLGPRPDEVEVICGPHQSAANAAKNSARFP